MAVLPQPPNSTPPQDSHSIRPATSTSPMPVTIASAKSLAVSSRPSWQAGCLILKASLWTPSGNLFDLADTANQRICKFAAGVLTVVAGNGTTGFGGDGGPATSASLNSPYGLAVDTGGNLYIADTENQRIRKVANGVITTVAGTGTPGFSGDGSSGHRSAQLATPLGLTVDSSGSLYIADRDNSRIRKLANGVVSTVAEADAPISVALDSAGNVYVSGAVNGKISKITNGVIATVAGGGTPTGLSAPSAVAVDSARQFVCHRLGQQHSLEDLGRVNRLPNRPQRSVEPPLGRRRRLGRKRLRRGQRELSHSQSNRRNHYDRGGQRNAKGFSGDGGPAISSCS